MRRKFSFTTITALEPGVQTLFDEYIRQCVKDCRDRPGLGKSRAVRLEVVIAPEDQETANIDGVIVQINVNKVIPKQVTKAFSLALNVNNELAFNEADPTSHHSQRTLDEANDPPPPSR